MNIEYEHDEIFETAKDDFQSYHSIYVQQRFVWIYSRPINDSIIVGFGEVPVSTSNQYIKITLITWHWNSFFYFLNCRQQIQNIHSISGARLDNFTGFLPNCFLKSGLNRFLRKNGFGFLFRYLIFFDFRVRFNIAGWNLNGSLVIYTCVLYSQISRHFYILLLKFLMSH